MTSPTKRHAAPILSADGLGFSVEGKWLLKDVTLTCRPGEWIGVIGPNGAGKSTLLYLLAGLLRPIKGEVWLAGHPVNRYDRRRLAQQVAFLPQSPATEISMVVSEMVLLGRYPYGSRFSRETSQDFAVAEEAMRMTQTLDLADRDLATLSGGERQRVYLARAVAQEPSLLVLDEPTANLDIHHELHVMNLVRRQADRGLAVIAALHDLELAASFCDQLLLLKDGESVAFGSPRKVLTSRSIREVYGVHAWVEESPLTGRLRIEVDLSDATLSRRGASI